MVQPNGGFATCDESHFLRACRCRDRTLAVIGSGLHSTGIAGRRLVLLGVGRMGNLSTVMEASLLDPGLDN